MTEDPFEELLADDPLLNVVELAVALFESVPFWVWILVALFVLKVVRDASSSGQADRTTVPRDERTQRGGPSHEEYSIHDDLDDDRGYRTPSESDPIVTTNEVDRSLLGKLKRLARIGRSSSRDR